MQAEARSRLSLKQLVYSSLEAIIEADARMSQNMIDTIKKFSDDMGHDDDGYPVAQLKTLQLVFDQLKHDDLDMLCSEKIGLEIPLLSIIPLSGLKISKSKVRFSAEVQEMDADGDNVQIYTKVSAAESERGAQNSRIDFEIEMESLPPAEGLSRVIDQLGQNYMPNVREKHPVDSDGNRLDGAGAETYLEQKELRAREQRISKLLTQLNEMQRVDDESPAKDKAFADMEPYKAVLEKRLADIRKNGIRARVARELELDHASGGQQAPEKTEGAAHERKKPKT